MKIDQAFADVQVQDVEGQPVRLGSLWEKRPAVLWANAARAQKDRTINRFSICSLCYFQPNRSLTVAGQRRESRLARKIETTR